MAGGRDALNRLRLEWKGWVESPVDAISVVPTADDFFTWNVVFVGTEDTPYEHGCFRATLKFPKDYPMSPVRGRSACHVHTYRSARSLRCPRGAYSSCPLSLHLHAFSNRTVLHLPPHGLIPRHCVQPSLRFVTPILHPNIYATGTRTGDVCISILHQGEDATGYESSKERWSPVHSARTILLSVLSLLAAPNDESPANVDAATLHRNDPEKFSRVVRRQVMRSLFPSE
jgi:ubiquitin-protein ligase